MPKLSVHLLTWNGAKYLPYLFTSLKSQTFSDWQLVIIDNNSKDETLEVIKNELNSFPQPYHLQINEKNLGFARGHNLALRWLFAKGEGEYVLLLNQDMVLGSDYLERLIDFMDGHSEAGAAQGVLLKWDFEKTRKESLAAAKTQIIDTLGLVVLANRRVIDWGTGFSRFNFDFLKLDSPLEIFGVSGALPMYRLKALKEVAHDKEVFDEDFFSYKEDVDLAFRLRSAGWKAYLVPQAYAWHDRTTAGPLKLDDKSARENRYKKSPLVNYHSYKNHLFVLIKNEYLANFLRDGFKIVWYELKKFFYLLFFERDTLQSLKEFWFLLPKMLKKRQVIKSKRKLSAQEIRKWWNTKNYLLAN
jgi:GT2 family glycosyltransferase